MARGGWDERAAGTAMASGWGAVDRGCRLRDRGPVSMIGSSRFRKPPGRRRLRASGIDLAVIGGWAVVLAGGSALWRAAGRDYGRVFRDPATVDLAQFATMVLPAGLYLAAGEAGARHATAGKRASGLVVVAADGSRPTTARIAVRTVVKLLPWQIAHLSITRAAGIVPGRHAATLSRAGLVTALGLATTSAALAVLRPDGRAMHDLVAGTRVAVRPVPPCERSPGAGEACSGGVAPVDEEDGQGGQHHHVTAEDQAGGERA